MFPLTIRINIQTLLLVFVLCFANGQDRKISPQLNPGCPDCTPDQTLMYVRAEGAEDTIHQLWDFTSTPTMIFAIAGVNSSLSIEWKNMDPVSFNFSEPPKYSFALAIDKLFEYDDLEDNGRMDEHSPRTSRSLAHLSWRRADTVLTETQAMVTMQGKFARREWENDTIRMKLDLLPFKDYAVDLPHLIHTANSTLVDVSLINLTATRGYNASRYGLHMTLVSLDKPEDSMHCIMRKSLDDEHTPGVFEIFEIKTPGSYRSDSGGFVQFRPVAYTQPERGVTTSTIAHVSDLGRTATLRASASLYRFYREYASVLVQGADFSFGEPGDGYYKQHNYTAWSFTMGYGAPPVENFSTFVILIISIGLGVPVLLALSGILYVVVRRCKQRNAPERFTNEE